MLFRVGHVQLPVLAIDREPRRVLQLAVVADRDRHFAVGSVAEHALETCVGDEHRAVAVDGDADRF